MPRIVNRKLLDLIKTRPCVVCNGKHGPSDPAHIKTRGSGGDDTEENVMPLCRLHHIEQTGLNWFRFCERYPKVLKELERRQWRFEEEFGVVKLRKFSGLAVH
jgi:hypothetical protein